MGAAVHQSGEYTNRFYAISFHVPCPGDQSSICSDKQINSCCAQMLNSRRMPFIFRQDLLLN